MLRFHPLVSAKAAEAYYAKSDGGYYLGDHRQQWLGQGAERLGLSGPPEFEQFKRLLHGLDPHTGQPLTQKLVGHRVPGWDVTASVPKGVTLALEWGDERVREAIWAAARETLADLEQHATTRVRTGGRHEDRVTGNLVAFAVEHAETRPAKCDGYPDPDRHIHMVVLNATYDPEEQRWKAVKFRPIMDLRKYFDRRFDLRLSAKLVDLGYAIETKYRNGRYYTWDLQGIPKDTLAKFSRRTAEIESLATELAVDGPVAKDKLGATSRAHKRADLTPDDCRRHWHARTTPAEDRRIEQVIDDARAGVNPPPANTAEHGMRFAVAHLFERQSVTRWTDLAITAMEQCLGGATPEEIEPEAIRQGVLFKDGQVTTRQVLAEEANILAFAREGRGACRPLGPPDPVASAALAAEQRAVVAHALASKDRVVLIEGRAGTGKTTTDAALVAALEGAGRRVAKLAPTAAAAREVLRQDFPDADTLAAFRRDAAWQERTDVVLLDEMPLGSIRDVAWLCDWARQDPRRRLIFQGDFAQHKSVARHGSVFRLLQEHAGLPVARLTEIRRQRHDGYKKVVAAIARGDRGAALAGLSALGWVKPTDGHAPLVRDYLEAVAEHKSVLVVAPTHAVGEEITAEIRGRLKDDGTLGEERTVPRLVPQHWTDAMKGDLDRFDGTETLVFTRNSGTFKAGQRVKVSDWQPGMRWADPSHFAVYREETLPVAAGDRLRVTANGTTADGHRLNNGAVYTVKGFTRDGVVLNNGWTVPADFGHLAHGYVSTSYAAQGRTVDRVLVCLTRAALPAVSAEAFYVALSRGRESARVYTDLPKDELKQAVGRSDPRTTATELMTPKPQGRQRPSLRKRLLAWFGRLREAVERGITPELPREVEHGRV